MGHTECRLGIHHSCSEIFSARRVRWIFDRELSGSAIKIEVPSFEQRGYTRNRWWETEQGVTAFQTELLKYVYYSSNTEKHCVATK